MFITDLNGNVVMVDGKKKTILFPDIKVTHLLNHNGLFYFAAYDAVFDHLGRTIIDDQCSKLLNIHQTQCSSRMVVVTYETHIIILKPRVKLPNLGRLEYYSAYGCIYKTESNFILVTKKTTRILFPSVFNVRFINGITPVGHIELHVFMLSNGILVHRIYDTKGNILWESNETICKGEMQYYYVNHRSSYHILSDSVLYSFMENGERKVRELDNYRIIDRCIIDYKKPIRLIDLAV